MFLRVADEEAVSRFASTPAGAHEELRHLVNEMRGLPVASELYIVTSLFSVGFTRAADHVAAHHHPLVFVTHTDAEFEVAWLPHAGGPKTVLAMSGKAGLVGLVREYLDRML